MDGEVKVKAKFNGTSRRFAISSSITWQELSTKLTTLFNLGPNFRLKYCDDENELVLISSQEELNEALKVYHKKSGLLSLFIEDPNFENRKQNEYQLKADGKQTGYAAAAAASAPEFNKMNERLQAKMDEEAKKINKPASMHDEHVSLRCEASAVSIQEEEPTGYVKLEEVMAQIKSESQAGSDGDQKQFVPSFEQEQPSQQSANTDANGTSRGWFLEDQSQQLPPSSRGNGKTKKTKKKKPRNGYSAFASVLAPQLAAVDVKEPPKKTDAVTSEDDDTGMSEPTSTTDPNPSPQISGGSLNSPADFNQQQKIQNGQQREFKRSRRPKRHGRKKGCYAQAALDIGPLYQAMNDRLKEQQLLQQNSQETVSLSNGSEGEDPSPEDSPSSEFLFGSYVFVNRTQDGQPSFSPALIEAEQTEVVDVVENNGSIGHTSQPPEQHVDSESSGEDKEKKENTAKEEQKDINVVVKEVLHSSMDYIVEQAVQRVQQISLNSRQAPSDEDSSAKKVLHKGITCDTCELEIQGIRYKCCNCLDFDLCEPCESKNGIHEVGHVFVKLRFPAPGIGRRHGQMVPIFRSSVYKKSHHDDKKLKKAEARAQRKAAKEAEKEEKRAALKSQEKERKRDEKHLRKQRHEVKKFEQQQQPPIDPKAQRMAKVYEKLKMEYVHDLSFPDGSVVSPGQKFLKTWLIQNSGTIAWNQWIKLDCIEGDIMVTPEKSQANVPHLFPGMQGEVSLEFVAPELPGTYSSKWHLTYGSHTFGPQLWCEIEVATPSNEDKEKPVQYDQTTLVNSAFVKDTPVSNDALVEDTKLQAASYLIVDDGSGSEYHSSEETPETQPGCREVPVSSMEAQQRQDLEWDAGCVHDIEVLDVSTENEETFNLISFSGTEDVARSNNSEDSDDEEDSDSSLDEFTVLIPPCFYLETPLSADPVPVKVECPKRSGSFDSKFLPKSFEPYLNLDDNNLDDNNEPSSLPTMSSSVRAAASFENSARNTEEPTKVQSTPVLTPDVEADQGEETPSGRISPMEYSNVQGSTQTETPISRQPQSTPGESVPLVSHPPAIADRARSHDGRTSPLPTNVVSDVLSSAIDVVANAGRAAFATVDNFISGGVQASATYKPEDDCEVTVDRRSNNSFDAPPTHSISRAPDNNPMGRLIEMGFADRRLNEQLLRKHNNDIRATIDELLNHTENEWSSQRH